MKFLAIIILSLFANSLFAMSELDVKLQDYVQAFNLKPVTPPSPLNKQLFLLGKNLFFEKAISGNKNISCAECHHPQTMTTDKLPLSVGEGAEGIETVNGGRQQQSGKMLARNAPALFNLHNAPTMFWDGRVEFDAASGKFTTPSELPDNFKLVLKNALAAQALFPMVNHAEMRGDVGSNEIANAKTDADAWQAIFKRVVAIPSYKAALEDIFPGEVLNLAHVASAIAHFEEQAFYAADTNYDRYLKGDLKAMTEIQKMGMDIFFGKGKCGECHKGENLSDFSYQNVGTPQIGPGKVNGDDFGRLEQDPRPENKYAFRVPPLRNALMTAPYMHNGAFKTIAQIVEHYDDIEVSLREYKLVNNYKNYVEKIFGPLRETIEDKLDHLSNKLPRKIGFLETEEKAVAEFITGALTDNRFLAAEIDGDYITSLRIQLTEPGYKKLLATLPSDATTKKNTYFYFDIYNSEIGYGLRELQNPIKLYITQNDETGVMTYRRQAHKASSSVEGLVGVGTFEQEEMVDLAPETLKAMAKANNDFFARLYTYNNESGTSEIPALEKTIMKNDVLSMNELWHSISYNSLDALSDLLGVPKDDLFYAPTSTNSKVEYFWAETINSRPVNAVLQKSTIRTEVGGMVTTWAIEMKMTKTLKKDLPQILNAWLMELKSYDLVPTDAQGTSPSPSKLTEATLNEIM
ncbi:MAG: cytochrome-c peroxidase [Bacteriovoracaceae bacterium]